MAAAAATLTAVAVAEAPATTEPGLELGQSLSVDRQPGGAVERQGARADLDRLAGVGDVRGAPAVELDRLRGGPEVRGGLGRVVEQIVEQPGLPPGEHADGAERGGANRRTTEHSPGRFAPLLGGPRLAAGPSRWIVVAGAGSAADTDELTLPLRGRLAGQEIVETVSCRI